MGEPVGIHETSMGQACGPNEDAWQVNEGGTNKRRGKWATWGVVGHVGGVGGVWVARQRGGVEGHTCGGLQGKEAGASVASTTHDPNHWLT